MFKSYFVFAVFCSILYLLQQGLVPLTKIFWLTDLVFYILISHISVVAPLSPYFLDVYSSIFSWLLILELHSLFISLFKELSLILLYQFYYIFCFLIPWFLFLTLLFFSLPVLKLSFPDFWSRSSFYLILSFPMHIKTFKAIAFLWA